MAKEVEVIIKAKMNERWVNDFLSMLKYMESCGNMGHSAVVGFYSDGDGDFRPKFEFDTEYEPQHGYWEHELVKEDPDLDWIIRTEEWAQNIAPRYNPVFCTDGNKLWLVDEFGCSAKCPDGRFQIKY